MSRTRNYIQGLGTGFFSQALFLFGGLLVTPLFLSLVGNQNYGCWLVTLQYIAVLSLLDFGILAVLPREIALRNTPHPEKQEQIQTILEETRFLVLCLSVVLLPILLFTSQLLHQPCWLVINLSFLLLLPFRTYPLILRGLQDLGFLGLVQAGSWIVQIGCTLGLGYQGWGFLSFILGWICGEVFQILLCRLRLMQRFPWVLATYFCGSWPGDWRKNFSMAGWVGVIKAGCFLVNGVEILLLGWILGPLAVVMYCCTAKLFHIFQNNIQILFSSAEAGLCQIIKTDCAKLQSVFLVLMQLILLAAGLIASLIIGLNRGFVFWWVGPEYYAGSFLTLCLCCTLVLRFVNYSFTQLLYCLGREKLVALSIVAGGSISTGTILFTASTIGFLAIPLGSLMGILAASMPMNLSYLATSKAVSMKRICRNIVTWIFATMAMIGMGYLVNLYWLPDSFVELLITGITIIGGYLIVMFPFVYYSGIRVYLKPYITATISGTVLKLVYWKKRQPDG